VAAGAASQLERARGAAAAAAPLLHERAAARATPKGKKRNPGQQ
jgi:hypothetical protein